jgi:hypothetical protein
MKKNFLILCSILLFIGLIGFPTIAKAEGSAFGNQIPENISGGPQRAYGTSSSTIFAIQPLTFRGYDATQDALITGSGGNRTCSGSCTLEASAYLPSGANINAVEIESNDTDPSGAVSFIFGNCPIGQALCNPLAAASSGISETPGYSFPTQLISHTVNNFNNTYLFEVSISGTAELAGARVYYNLQISPAPGVATFNDVGLGHWAFQFVEALAASNITTGCGGNNFCPNGNVTRAEMAAFIARALGLHWPL